MLPKIDLPIAELILPSTKQKIRIRSMTVKEEKILLRAKEGSAPNEIFLAINQVVNNCMFDMDVNKLTLFDVEFLFLRIRSMSIGNEVEIVYTDQDDPLFATEPKLCTHKFTIDLDKIEVKFPETSMDIVVGTGGITLQYPKAGIYNTEAFHADDPDPDALFNELVLSCMLKYYNGETVVNFNTATPAEVYEFIDNLDVKTYGKIKDFIANLPTVYHEVKYVNTAKEEKTLKLSSLTDFFSLV